MKSRPQFLIVAAVIVLIVVLAVIKGCQISQAIAAHSKFSPPPEAVTSAVLTESTWQKKLHAVGSLESPAGSMLSAEAAGRVQTINFESGVAVNAGAVLLELDSQVERASLAAAQASRDEAALAFDRARKLRATNTIAQSEFDEARARSQSAEANVQSLEAALKRRAIVAPYNGILGIRQVAPGEYITTGTPVVALQSLDPLYVNFSLPQSDIASISVGQPIAVTLDAFPGQQFTGKVTAIDSEINTSTRTIAVQGTIANPKQQLRPGMFSRIDIMIDQQDKVIAVPVSAISYAPYGDTIYVIETMKDPEGKEFKGVRQQIVKIGEHRGDQAVALSGLKAGEEVVTSGTFKLRPNAAVLVNNEIQPGNTTDPRPEDQ